VILQAFEEDQVGRAARLLQFRCGGMSRYPIPKQGKTVSNLRLLDAAFTLATR
jgi:hypothetical protein